MQLGSAKEEETITYNKRIKREKVHKNKNDVVKKKINIAEEAKAKAKADATTTTG
jgi:hypothetical protein